MINMYIVFWVALTFFVFLITASNIKNHKLIGESSSIPKVLRNNRFDIETSFYKTDATLHDIIFFHASASGVAIVLLFLVLKGKDLFPGTVIFFGAFSSFAIFIISVVLLLLAFYFYTISIFKLGNTLVNTTISNQAINTRYAILCVFGYFLFFPILALILI